MRKLKKRLLTLCLALVMVPMPISAETGLPHEGSLCPALCTMGEECAAAEHNTGCPRSESEFITVTQEVVTTTPEAVATTSEAVTVTQEAVTTAPEGMDIPTEAILDGQPPEILEAVSGPVEDLVTFYIDKGDIVIGAGTVSGYDAEGTEVTASAVRYVVTQADANTPTDNTITVNGGEQSITLKDVNMVFDGPAAANRVSSLQIYGGDVTLTLEGQNTLTNNAAYMPGLLVRSGASLTITAASTDQSLTVRGTGIDASGIGAIAYYSGVPVPFQIKAGSVQIQNGTVTASGTGRGVGIGGAFGRSADGIQISGGIVTAQGGSRNEQWNSGVGLGAGQNGEVTNGISITGGTVNAIGGYYAIGAYKNGGNATELADVAIAVDGGSVKLEGDVGSSQGIKNSRGIVVSRTPVLVQEESGTVLGNTEVTVTDVAAGSTWTAKTDGEGYLYLYLPTGPAIFTLDRSSTKTAIFGGSSNSIGARCTCEGSDRISLDVADRIAILSITEGIESAIVPLSSHFEPAEDCKAAIHNGALYEVSTTVSGVAAPKMEGSLLTVYKWEEPYPITVKAVNGQNEKCYTQKTVVVETVEENGFSIADGTITAKLVTEPVTQPEGEPVRKITYKQGGNEVTIPESDKFVILGTSNTNTIIIESGNPNIVLDQVAINSGNSPSIWVKSGCPTFWLKGENSLCSTRATYATLQVNDGAGVIIDSEKDEHGTTNKNIPPTESVSGEAHALPQAKYAGSLTIDTPDIFTSEKYAPGIGAIRTQVGSKGIQIEIRGGNVTSYATNGLYKNIGAAIGISGMSSGTSAMSSVTISGGNVYTALAKSGVGIGGYNVAVSLTDGTIYSKVQLGSSGWDRGMAIGGFNSDISIGSSGDDENSKKLNVVAIGRQSYSAIGGLKPKIEIYSGNVYASSEGNASAIGANISSPIRSIQILGGNIWAVNSIGMAAIGMRVTSSGDPKTGGDIDISGGNIHVTGALGTDHIVTSDVTTVTVGSGAALEVKGNVGAPLVNNSSGTSITGNIQNEITANAPTKVSGNISGPITVASGGALEVQGNINSSDPSYNVTVESGGSLIVSGSVQSTVTNSGETVIGGNVDGDVTCSGGSVIIAGNVTGDLNASDGSIAVGGEVGGESNIEGAVTATVSAIIFNKNDGSGTIVGSVVRKPGDNRPLHVGEIPLTAWEAYIFEGWNTRMDGNGTPVTAGMEISGSITAYAQWTATTERKLFNAQRALVDGVLVVKSGTDLSEAVKGYVEGLLAETTDTTFLADGGVVSVEEKENGNYAVTLTLDGESAYKTLNMTITQTEKTTEELIEEALAALDSIQAVEGAYNGNVLAVMTEAVHAALAGTEFYNTLGRTVEVTGESGNFMVVLSLDGTTRSKNLDSVVTLAQPETDAEKAAYAIKDVADATVSVNGATGDADAELISAAKEMLRSMTTPYAGTDTKITVVLVSGVDRYRVTAKVGDESAVKNVVVTPIYEGYEPSEALEGHITGNTDIVLSNDVQANTTTLTVEFSTEPTGTVTYQWQKQSSGVWTDVTGGRTETLTLSALTIADDGAQYQCVVTHKVPLTIQTETTLTVAALTVRKGDQTELPELIVIQPADESGTGSISGLITAMEIKVGADEQAGEWTPVNETQAANGISEIPSGTVYQARYAETDYMNAGPVKTVKITHIVGVTVSGTVSSGSEENNPATVTLKQGETVVATTAAIGGTFTFDAVEAGEYTVEVSKEGHVTKIFELTVRDAEIADLEYAIYLLGDINEDGDIDVSDMQRLYSHLNKSNELSELKVGDVNGDGDVDVSDMQRLYSHLNKSNPLF